MTARPPPIGQRVALVLLGPAKFDTNTRACDGALRRAESLFTGQLCTAVDFYGRSATATSGALASACLALVSFVPGPPLSSVLREATMHSASAFRAGRS